MDANGGEWIEVVWHTWKCKRNRLDMSGMKVVMVEMVRTSLACDGMWMEIGETGLTRVGTVLCD